MRPSFAYLFERFPSYTQTFCFREAAEMHRQGMAPPIFSIRGPEKQSDQDFSGDILSVIQYLPEGEELFALVHANAPRRILRRISRWSQKPDKLRLYTAAYLGPILEQFGISHVHTHFAGIGARTAYWIKEFFGIGYSFTGHANDIFRDSDHPVSLEDLVREAQFVATVSDYSRDWLMARFPAYATKIRRVYNGIDVAKFHSKPRGSEGLQIISVGRCIEKKGFGDLIEACRILKERHIEFNCRIIGDGPLYEKLFHQIRQSGLQEQVTLAGPKTEAEVMEALSESNVFVLACVKEAEGGMDNLPTVIMEAMAGGLPVISTKVAGVPEMIVHKKTGLLLEPNDPVGLAEGLAFLAKSPECRNSMGDAARALARERFAVSVTTNDLKKLILSFANSLPTRSSHPIGSFWKKLWPL